jgi:mannose-1-phosphate guanylyltransferase
VSSRRNSGQEADAAWRMSAPVTHGDRQTQPPWAIVLAGGEGRRLRPLTRYVCGDDRPKQFAPLLGGRSLLRQTLDRIRPRIPLARTMVVTHARDAEYVAQEFARGEAPECLLQPEDRGSGAAILWAVHVIRKREPDAVVVVFPSDHYVDREPEFIGHVLDVVAFVRRRGERLVLIGAIPTEAETQYGWIKPGEPVGGIRGEAV